MKNNNFVYTYILLSQKDGKLYTGSTRNLRKRFEEHQTGKVFSTKSRRPFKLLYYEACLDEADARRREKSLKSFRGKMTLRRRLKSFFTGSTQNQVQPNKAPNQAENYRLVPRSLGGVGRIFGFLLFFALLATSYSLPAISEASTIKAPILNLGLVGHWSFDGKDTNWTSATTGTVTDASGNGNTGTLTSMAQATSPTDGVIGQAMEFDGVADGVEIGNVASLRLTGSEVTVSAWVYSKSLSGGQAVFYNGTNGTACETISLGVGSSGCTGGTASKYNFTIRTASGSVLTSTNTASLNEWQHVVGVYDGANMYLYINGAFDKSQAKTGNINSGANQFVTLGGDFSTTDRYFLNGSLDDVRIYNRALSTAEITRLYNIGAPSKIGVTQSTNSLSTGLVGHWSFDGKDTNWTSATAGTVTDASGNGNTGTLTSMNQATSPTDGVIGQAMEFDDGDYMDAGLISGADTSSGSVSVWFMQTSSDTGFVLQTDRDPNRGYLQTSASVGIDVDIRLGTSGFVRVENDASYGIWHHVAFTWNSGVYSVWFNGVKTIDGSSYTGTVGVSAFNLARYSVDSTFNWIGSIDDVRIYNRALSTAEITRLYNMGRPSVITE